MCTAVTARFVVPEGVRFLGGEKDIALGPMKPGDEGLHSATVEIPSEGQFLLAGGAIAP